jgi:hypothetical protein
MNDEDALISRLGIAQHFDTQDPDPLKILNSSQRIRDMQNADHDVPSAILIVELPKENCVSNGVEVIGIETILASGGHELRGLHDEIFNG